MKLPLKLIRKNLARRPLRTALTCGGVAVALFILVLVESLSRGLDASLSGSEAARTLIVYRQNRYCPQTSFLPERYSSEIESIAGVESVLPVKVFLNNCRASLDLVTFQGAPVERMLASRKLTLISGDVETFRAGADQALIGRTFAERRGLEAGEKFRFGSITLGIAGIFESSEPVEENVVLTHLEFLQRAAPVKQLGTVTQFEVKIRDSGDARGVAARIDSVFRTAEEPTDTRLQVEFLKAATRDLQDLLGLGRILGLVCVGVVLVLVGNTVLMSVNERRSEFGIFLTLGYSGRDLLQLVLAEAAALAVFGGAVGVAASWAVVTLTKLSIGVEGVSVDFRVSTGEIGAGLVVALVAALLAGLVPAVRAARADPVASLRGA